MSATPTALTVTNRALYPCRNILSVLTLAPDLPSLTHALIPLRAERLVHLPSPPICFHSALGRYQLDFCLTSQQVVVLGFYGFYRLVTPTEIALAILGMAATWTWLLGAYAAMDREWKRFW